MRVAIVNDLALAREVLRRVVLSLPDHSVAWMAVDGDEAVRKAAADRPDAILMDLVMPRVNGAEATRRIMRASPCPILVVTVTVPGNFDLVFQALEAGALDAVETPAMGPDGTAVNAERLVERLRHLAAVVSGVPLSLTIPAPTPVVTSNSVLLPRLVVIGASTGGPAALPVVLEALPPDLPAAVVIVQHIDARYAPRLADRLAVRCRLPVQTLASGSVPQPGVVYLAATNDHLELTSRLRLGYTPDPRGSPYRPSVDVLFASVAALCPRPGVGVLLTGMETDGAEGLLRLRQAGWHTIAQDEATSVVYGMPRAAVELRAAVEVLPLPRIGPTIVAKLRSV